MRIVFMGSPPFGLPTLRSLLAAGHDVRLVVSQPDRPAGRARRLTPPPVAAFALERGLPLYQPLRLRDDEARAPLKAADPEAIVVAAFGQILPRAVLDLAPFGCLNVHPSLLPRFRGASPVQAAILAGDTETGVTIIKLIERMDAGPMLAQARTPIGPHESALELESRLADLGAELMVDCLERWAAGTIVPREQNEAVASYCQRLERSDAELNWIQPAAQLDRVVRAFRGRTDAFSWWESRLLKVLAARPLDEDTTTVEPGRILPPDPARGGPPRVATGAGSLALLELGLEGRRAVSGEAFLNGQPRFLGARLGRPSDDSAPS